MDVPGHSFCSKCRTCNTITSNQPGSLNITTRLEASGDAGLASGDALPHHDLAASQTVFKCQQTIFEFPHHTEDISSTDSSAHLSISSATSSPRSEDGYIMSSRRKKQALQSELVLQQESSDSKDVVGLLPLQDRNVVGQEKSPVSGISALALASTATSSLQRATSEATPKERKRWARPPLIGQAASNNEVKLSVSEDLETLIGQDSSLDNTAKAKDSDVIDIPHGVTESSPTKTEKSKGSSSNESGNMLSSSKSLEAAESADEHMSQTPQQTIIDGEQGLLSDCYVGGKISPSSSVASHKRLEWDSGADVGYQDYQPSQETNRASILKLSAIERLALIQNTDKALRMRLDPEGTSNSLPSTRNGPTPTYNTYPLSLQLAIGQPSAESTPIERASSLTSQRKTSHMIGISPIVRADSSKPVPAEKRFVDDKPVEDDGEDKKLPHDEPKRSGVSRKKSTSMLNLQSTGGCPSEFLFLYRSQSDPDLSTDAEALVNDPLTLKAGMSLSPEKSLKGKGLDARSLSSDSEKTLIHISAKKPDGNIEMPDSDDSYCHETQEQLPDRNKIISDAMRRAGIHSSASKGYSCSDTDHRHGLHHHYGVICSSCLILPTEQAPILDLSRGVQSSSSTPCSNNSENGLNDQPSENKNAVSHMPVAEEAIIQQRPDSVSPPVDGARGGGTSECVGKATSFEYLPGRLYERELAVWKGSQLRQPERAYSRSVTSDSTSADSRQNSVKLQTTRHSKRQAVVTSSGDSEDALWSSPRGASGTLVHDLERGVGTLRGVLHQQAYSTAAQRALVRRIVRRLVSSDYTDDLLEKRLRRSSRRPLSGGHTFGFQPAALSTHTTETEKRFRSAPHRSSKGAQFSSVHQKEAEAVPLTETASQASDSISSSANESSSLRSSVDNERLETQTKDPVQRADDAQATSRSPPSPVPHPSNLPTEPAPSATPPGTPNAAPATLKPEPAATLPKPAPPVIAQPPSAPVPPAPNAAAATSKLDSAVSQTATDSTTVLSQSESFVTVATDSLPKRMSAAVTKTSNAATAESTCGLPFVTLSSVVSITPMMITVQSSPAALPLTEVASADRPISVVATTQRAATVNAATMTVSPPAPPVSLTRQQPAATPTTAGRTTDTGGEEMPRCSGSSDGRHKKNTLQPSASHPNQHLEWIKCEINHYKRLKQLLKKHPQYSTKPLMERPATSQFSQSKKSKITERPKTADPGGSRRSRHHTHTHPQERPPDDRLPTSILKKPPPTQSSVNNSNTESSLSSSTTSVSTSAPEYCACGAAPAPRPTSIARENADERQPHPQKRAEPTVQVDRSRQREPSPESEDSVTRAVTHAVSSRVKALRNLGQIEEAEVKIRVRMGQPADSDGIAPQEKPAPKQSEAVPKVIVSQARPRMYRTVDTSAEDEDFASRQAELDEMIARQRQMDVEARKKLEALTKLRERILHQTTGGLKKMESAQPQRKDACTLTSYDAAPSRAATSPVNAVPVSRENEMKSSRGEASPCQTSSSSPSSACPACRVRAANRNAARRGVAETGPMCERDLLFSAGAGVGAGADAGAARGRRRPPLAYFLKLKEEEVVRRPRSPARKVSSLQVVTVKVPRRVRPPSSLGSSSASSASSSSGQSTRSDSPERFQNQMTFRHTAASSAPIFRQTAESQSAPESNRRHRLRETERKAKRVEVKESRSVPHMGRGDGDYSPPSSAQPSTLSSTSEEQVAIGFSLQDCLTTNFPEYVRAAETRRQCIYEMSYLRRLRQESRKRLVQLDGDAWRVRQKLARNQRPATAPAPPPAPPPKPQSKKRISARSMRLTTARKYALMPEIEQRRQELKKQEEGRTNRLLKEIYTRKLREKALRGETTLRSSVSVISTF